LALDLGFLPEQKLEPPFGKGVWVTHTHTHTNACAFHSQQQAMHVYGVSRSMYVGPAESVKRKWATDRWCGSWAFQLHRAQSVPACEAIEFIAGCRDRQPPVLVGPFAVMIIC
jgi:hypothetical protein